MALVRAEDDVGEAHDEVGGGQGEEHDEDVEVDEAEPVEEGGARAAVQGRGGAWWFVEEVGWRGGSGTKGKRWRVVVIVVVVVDGVCCCCCGVLLPVWEVVCVRDGWGWVGIIIMCGCCALRAWVRQVAARDAVEKVERGHCRPVNLWDAMMYVCMLLF